MSSASQVNLRFSGASDTSMLKQQLEKEVSSLVRQLNRERSNGEQSGEFDDCAILKHYESMIESRRKMLHNLPVGSISQVRSSGF